MKPKQHLEFVKVDLDSGWEVPPGYPPGCPPPRSPAKSSRRADSPLRLCGSQPAAQIGNHVGQILLAERFLQVFRHERYR